MKRKQGVRSLTRVPWVQVAHPVARIPGPERKADTAFADCARLKQQDSSDCVQGCRQRDAPGAGCSGQGPDGMYTSEQNARCQARPKLMPSDRSVWAASRRCQKRGRSFSKQPLAR